MTQEAPSIILREDLPASVQAIPEGHDPLADGILMKHQIEWIEDKSDLKLMEKGRRTGITYAEALDDTITAATRRSDGGDNVFYIGDTKDKGLEFIGYCAHFARVVAKEMVDIEEFLFEDKRGDGESKFITAYRIRFASGFKIEALSSRPENIRGLQGIVVIDEAAFHADVRVVIRACNALIIWGGKIRIISTHNGAENAFAELIADAKAGRYPYSLHRVTFDDAVANGLYERVCLVKGWTPGEEGKRQWHDRVLGTYGTDTEGRDEELFCIAREGEGIYFPLSLLEKCARPGIAVVRWEMPSSFAAEPDHIRQAEARDWCDEYLSPVLSNLDPALMSYFGEDFGRSGDLTDIWPYQIDQNMTRQTPFVSELRNIPYREQELILFYIVDRLPRFMAGALDASGNGHYLAERAMQRYGAGRIEEVKLSQDWYRQNMPVYKAAFEDGDVEIPKDKDIISDHRSVRMVKGIAKVPDNARSKGTDGKQRHGDSAIAGALAFYASRMEVAPIAYLASGQTRAAARAYQETGETPPVIDDHGFGRVQGGMDLQGF